MERISGCHEDTRSDDYLMLHDKNLYLNAAFSFPTVDDERRLKFSFRQISFTL